MTDLIQNLFNQLSRWLQSYGLHGTISDLIAWAVFLAAVGGFAWGTLSIGRRLLLQFVSNVTSRTSNTWDDALVQRRVFHRLIYFIPPVIGYLFASALPWKEDTAHWVQRLCIVVMLLLTIWVSSAVMNAVNDIFATMDVSRRRPIKSFTQIIQILVLLMFGTSALAILLNRSPWILLSGFGAITAILLLVFKDTLLGLVASIQLTSNKMLILGDWISMPKYGADGTVVEINLTTVKVQNFDKTLTTIPTYMLVSDSFTNYRGMTESGVRRIKKAIPLDMASIHSVTETTQSGDSTETNLGSLRQYLAGYLRKHPRVHPDMECVVRLLEATPQGLPLEIYCFTREQNFSQYEAVVAELTEHVLAVLPQFDLRVSQIPLQTNAPRIIPG